MCLLFKRYIEMQIIDPRKKNILTLSARGVHETFSVRIKGIGKILTEAFDTHRISAVNDKYPICKNVQKKFSTYISLSKRID